MRLAAQLVRNTAPLSYAPAEHGGSNTKQRHTKKISCPPCCKQDTLLSCLGAHLAIQIAENHFRLFLLQLRQLAVWKLTGVVINSLSVSSENICENGKKKTLTRKEKRKVLLLFAASTFYRKRCGHQFTVFCFDRKENMKKKTRKENQKEKKRK